MRRIFLLIYRIVIPFICFCVIAPRVLLPTENNSSFEQGVWIFIIILISLAFISATLLDQVPSRTGFLKLGLWRRYGTFRESQFLPYFDRATLPYFYFFNAFMVSLLISWMILWIKPFPSERIYSWNHLIGLATFFLLLVPYIVQYPKFRENLYRS